MFSFNSVYDLICFWTWSNCGELFFNNHAFKHWPFMRHSRLCTWLVSPTLYNCLHANHNYFFGLTWRRLLRIVGDVLGNTCNTSAFTGCNLLWHVHVSPYEREHRAAQFPSELEQPTSSNVYGVHGHKTCLSHCWNAVWTKSNSVSLVVNTESGESIIIACYTVERCWSKIISCFWFLNDDLRNTSVAISVHLLFLFGQGSFSSK